MQDVALEPKQSLSRKEATVWLHALSQAFERGGEAEISDSSVEDEAEEAE